MKEADELVREKHHDAVNIQRKVSSVEKRWQRFLTNVEEYRGLLEAAVEFYQLYEQVSYEHKDLFWKTFLAILAFLVSSDLLSLRFAYTNVVDTLHRSKVYF